MIVAGLNPLMTRATNVVMARAFFPRAKNWIYPRLAGSFTSVSMVEPFSAIGSMPGLTQFKGRLLTKDIESWSMNVPNLLFKNAAQIRQEQYEFDQTGTILQLSQALGIRVAEFPDQLFASRLLKASNVADTTVMFKGQSYSLTFDGKPYFATDHNTYRGHNQSNIIQGTHPNSTAAFLAQDMSDCAQQLQRDFSKVINHFKTLVDSEGIPLFPTIDMKKNAVVVIPPALEQAAQLAFRVPGSVIEQTTNVTPMFVKDVISTGYLDGFIDPDTGDEVRPINETDWYVMLTDDWVKPMYVQLFRPMRPEERFPPGGPVNDRISQVLSEVNGITVDQATVFASTRVDTTFNNIGANADAYTIQQEAFLMSGRYRGNMVYGPWMTGCRVIPSGGDISDQNAGGESSSSSSSSSSDSSSSPSSSSSSSSS